MSCHRAKASIKSLPPFSLIASSTVPAPRLPQVLLSESVRAPASTSLVSSRLLASTSPVSWVASGNVLQNDRLQLATVATVPLSGHSWYFASRSPRPQLRKSPLDMSKQKQTNAAVSKGRRPGRHRGIFDNYCISKDAHLLMSDKAA